MAVSYHHVLEESVFEAFILLPASHREQWIRIFRALTNDPFQRRDSSFLDGSHREIQKSFFGQWAVSFWADHPVKEVRIVGFQRVGRG